METTKDTSIAAILYLLALYRWKVDVSLLKGLCRFAACTLSYSAILLLFNRHNIAVIRTPWAWYKQQDLELFSVPHWTRFQRHFRCNLRQECVSGENELHCPYAPCQNGGVSFAGHCYFFLATDDDRVTRSSAERECRMAGANVVSLASPGEWSDVISWLHMGIPWLDTPAYMILYLGLMQPTSTSPFMWVEKLHNHDRATGTFLL